MKTGLIVLCRYSSSRLPGKILKEIHGEPLLKRIITRLRSSTLNLPVIVATSDDQSDDLIEDFCLKEGVTVFRGSLNDVAGRFLSCALEHNLDYAIRINGDNLFTDSVLIDEMVTIAESGKYDFVSNVEGRSFPHGMSVEIVKTSFYQQIYEFLNTTRLKEHVTLYLYDNQDKGARYSVKNTLCPFEGTIQLAIDTPKDVEIAEKIISFAEKPFEALTYCEIIEIYKSLNS